MSDASITVTGIVAAPVERVFALLADPDRHPELDASGMLRHAGTHVALTAIGDVFTMAMQNAGDYEVENHVVVFEPDRAIGWAPALPGQTPAGHTFVWRLTRPETSAPRWSRPTTGPRSRTRMCCPTSRSSPPKTSPRRCAAWRPSWRESWSIGTKILAEAPHDAGPGRSGEDGRLTPSAVDRLEPRRLMSSGGGQRRDDVVGLAVLAGDQHQSAPAPSRAGPELIASSGSSGTAPRLRGREEGASEQGICGTAYQALTGGAGHGFYRRFTGLTAAEVAEVLLADGRSSPLDL